VPDGGAGGEQPTLPSELPPASFGDPLDPPPSEPEEAPPELAPDDVVPDEVPLKEPPSDGPPPDDAPVAVSLAPASTPPPLSGPPQAPMLVTMPRTRTMRRPVLRVTNGAVAAGARTRH
jgi:protein TonB